MARSKISKQFHHRGIVNERSGIVASWLRLGMEHFFSVHLAQVFFIYEISLNLINLKNLRIG